MTIGFSHCSHASEGEADRFLHLSPNNDNNILRINQDNNPTNTISENLALDIHRLLRTTSIHQLHIADMQHITDNAFLKIINAIETAEHIRELDFNYRQFADDPPSILLQALLRNTTLNQIRIGIDTTNPLYKIIGFIQTRNTLIHFLLTCLQKTQGLAFLLGTHPRLGQYSPIKTLPKYILKSIFDYTVSPSHTILYGSYEEVYRLIGEEENLNIILEDEFGALGTLRELINKIRQHQNNIIIALQNNHILVQTQHTTPLNSPTPTQRLFLLQASY